MSSLLSTQAITDL